MRPMSVVAAIVNLSQPDRYFHWSIFLVSEANLALIAVMVVLFALALLLPFPGHHRRGAGASAFAGAPDGSGGSAAAGRGGGQTGLEAPAGPDRPTGPASDGPSATPALAPGGATGSGPATERGVATGPDMWTAKVRRLGLRFLPPDKLLPDSQPAYVASWIYVFGVAALAALAMAIVSGFLIALGGVDWWHTNPVGHFCNSLHLWSVELFMAFMVIHLWGKFWMAAWRGRRALTWMTGVAAFVASVVECFTGYLSQQNFDSQWISTNGKDAVNATGLGGFFNLMNFGQMLLWHVVLLPVVLVALVGVHVLLVRVRGVSHPLPDRRPRGRAARRAAAIADAEAWQGPTRPYDILKEASAATAIVLVLVVVLAALLSSPDLPPVTVQSWAKVAPADFLATAGSELAGTSETATYGPPYNHGSAFVQGIGISWQELAGVRIPIDAADAFVLSPLEKESATDPSLATALARYRAAPPATQHAWTTAYLRAATHVRFVGGAPVLPPAADGPVPTLLATELTLARSGALDTDLIAERAFYGTNYTKPLLFIEDGEYFASLAAAQHLTGTQWGVMNETGSYPGQPWLWLYTLWYQIPSFSSSANVDLIAIYLTGAATLLLLGLPFIPGLRDIPTAVPVHRLVWRSWYRRGESGAAPGPGGAGPDSGGRPDTGLARQLRAEAGGSPAPGPEAVSRTGP